MHEFEILTLGPPELRHDGLLYHLTRRTPRALLFYLGARESAVGRDELIALFWGKLPERAARRRLSDTLSRLRKSLPDPDLILIDTQLVSINFERVYVDQCEFHKLLAQTQGQSISFLPNEPLPFQVQQGLEKAAALWRSPQYLAGANFPSTINLDDWLSKTSQEFEGQYIWVLERLAKNAYAKGALQLAIELTNRALQIDSLNEDLHFQMMQILLESGKPALARLHYEQASNMIEKELGGAPGKHLTSLYQQIQGLSDVEEQDIPKSNWRLHLTIKSPFVGRSQAMDQLRRAWIRGGGILILGESGAGKTRIIQEFVDNLESQPRLLVTNCYPTEGDLPFQPIIEILRTSILPQEWSALPEFWVKLLALLVPEIRSWRADIDFGHHPDPQQATPSEATRSQLFEALRQLFIIVFKQRRGVFCLDDAHWSDEATLSALAYLLERVPFNRHALLILAARPEDSQNSLDKIIPIFEEHPRYRSVHLEKLSWEEVSEITQHVLGYMPSKPFLDLLAKETGGNPFFILESLRALVEADQDLNAPMESTLPLAESAQNLIQVRIDQLSKPARAIIDSAAVTGREFGIEIIIDTCDLDEQTISNALQELEQRGLIEQVDPFPEKLQYRFIHEKIRELLLQRMEIHQLRMLHRRVADALRYRLPLREQAAVLAQHYEYAGEISMAFDLWIQAGRHATQLYAFDVGEKSFSKAARLISQSGILSDQQVYTLYSAWTRMYFEKGDLYKLKQRTQELLSTGNQRESLLLIGTALGRLSDAAVVANRYEEALVFANQAVERLGESAVVVEQIEAYNRQGTCLYLLNQITPSIEAFQGALSFGNHNLDKDILTARANAHFGISYAHTFAGHPQRGRSHALQSLADFNTNNLTQGQSNAYAALSYARYAMGEYKQAQRDCLLAIDLAQRNQAEVRNAYLYTHLAMIENARGEIDPAFYHAKRAIELGEKYSMPEISARGYRVLGDLFDWLGDFATAIKHYRAAHEANEKGFMSADYSFRTGYMLCRLGHIENGLRILEEALETTLAQGFGIIQIQIEICMMLVYRMLEDWDHTEELAHNIANKARHSALNSAYLSAASMLGEIALQRGETEKAITHFHGVIEKTPKLPHPWLELHALSLLNRAFELSGGERSFPQKRTIQIKQQLLDKTTNPELQKALKEAFSGLPTL